MSAERNKMMKDLAKDAKFQLKNVDGWISSKCYMAALIKSRYLVEALELLAELEDKELAESGIN